MEFNYNTEQISALIKNRRSIYPNQYELGKVVPDEIIWQILENANHAPNHKQTEPWRFIVYSGDGLKSFAKLQSDIYFKNISGDFKQARYDKLLNYPLMSSHIIAIGMKRSERKELLPEIEEIEAVACAVQNMFLTVTAFGLGCYWTTAGITYMEAAKPYFDLGPEDKLLGFLYIGYVAKPFEGPSKRRDIRNKVKWVIK